MYDTKLTNPKDAIGSAKLPLHLVPDTLKVFAAQAFLEGALKYGGHNWRVAGVRASIYRAALDRHIAKWWNGEWADPKTGVPHLANALACIGIILDAHVAGKLTDDRPPAVDMAALIDGMEARVAQLKNLLKEHSPHHCTQLHPVPTDIRTVASPDFVRCKAVSPGMIAAQCELTSGHEGKHIDGLGMEW